MNVLVTGPAGFIASHCCERLLGAGHRIVGVENFDPFYDRAAKERNLAGFRDDERFTFVQADAADVKAMQRVFDEHGPFDVVLHLAAKAGVRPSIEDPMGYERANVATTTNLLECSVKRQSRRPRFVFASSSSVYGNTPKVPFSEDDPVDLPISPYAATKKACELICHTFHHLYAMPVTCLRFFTVYGPRQRPDLAIHKFTARLMRDEPIEMFGDGTSSRDYTYIDDVVDGIVAAIDRCAGYEVINLGSEHPVTLSEMIATIEQAVGKTFEIRRLPDQPGDVDRTFADVRKAERLLDYHPSMPFSDGIGRFVAWYRQGVLGESDG